LHQSFVEVKITRLDFPRVCVCVCFPVCFAVAESRNTCLKTKHRSSSITTHPSSWMLTFSPLSVPPSALRPGEREHQRELLVRPAGGGLERVPGCGRLHGGPHQGRRWLGPELQHQRHGLPLRHIRMRPRVQRGSEVVPGSLPELCQRRHDP